MYKFRYTAESKKIKTYISQEGHFNLWQCSHFGRGPCWRHLL